MSISNQQRVGDVWWFAWGLVLGAVCLSTSGCQTTADLTSPDPAWQTITLHDPWLNNMPAVTVNAPEDWVPEPISQRLGYEYSKQSLMIDLRVAAPDGRAVRFYPSMGFAYDRAWPAGIAPWSATAGGWIAMPPPETYGNWLLTLIEENPAPGVAGPRLIRETELPETQAALSKLYHPWLESYRQLNASMPNNLGEEFRARVQAHHASFTYTRNEVPELAHFVLVVFRVDQINASGVAERGNWSIMAMQSKEGPAELGDSALLNDDAMQDVLDSWAEQGPWAEQNLRLMMRHTHGQWPVRHMEIGARPIDAELRQQKRQQDERRFKQLLHDAWDEIAGLYDR
ncbi:hypothetical protein [Algisphaera agarilytica]|uniref:Uncharacterized protein n=1 Tax=Algisphaera agarilytica TaxID=1385975 RepID=A0A7X0H586_9BACT|nr:hypothetical protein [Algisphaera agarilytica]MBB6429469.1 hypothetical protein [Algisphaera agarilytica]